jgi:hypothetical protein
MRNYIASLLVSVPICVYAAEPLPSPPRPPMTELRFDPVVTPIRTESQVIEDALAHYESMDKAKTNALSREMMAAHMSTREMVMADPIGTGTGRGAYIVETERRFRLADTNHDGRITRSEWNTAAGQNLLRMLQMPSSEMK